MGIADIVLFFLYMAGVVWFGSSFYKKNKSSSAFTIGDQNFPSWVVSMSIFATFVSSISYLALPGNAYQSNWNAFTFSLTIPIAALMAVKFFVPLYRKINSPSAYTFMEMRFGPWARIYVSACYLLTQVMRIGTILYLLALPFNALFGWNIILIIIVTGISVLTYSLLGGIQAVIWTDAIQGIILIAGAIVCALFLMFSMPEGAGQIFTIASEHNKFSLGSFSPDLSESTFWVVFMYGIIINLQNFGIDQNYVQRYMVSNSEKEAKKSAFSGGLLYIPVSMLFFFIGTSLFSYYNAYPEQLPVELQGPAMSDKVFPYFIVNNLPSGLVGIIVAAIFSAGMSTVSTSINSSATVFLTDYYDRFFNKRKSEKNALKTLYLSSFTVSFLGITVALAMVNVASALDAWWKLASIFSGGMLGLFLLAAFLKKIHIKGAIVGVILGLIVIFWMNLSPLWFTEEATQNLASPFHGYLTIVFGTMVIFLTGFLASLLLKRNTGYIKQIKIKS
ncbi:sodium:solute symporter [soil metagenome]